MIDALMTGKLHGTPQQRTSKAGKPFTTAKVLATTSKGEGLIVNVLVFNESAQTALLALGPGDALALAGSIEPTAWQDKDGNTRTGLDMIVSQVLTAYHVDKRRRAVTRQDQPQDPPPRPRHDAWIARTPGRPPAQEHLDHGDLDF